MTALELALAAALLCGISGVPSLFGNIPMFLGRRIACCCISSGTAVGMAAVWNSLIQQGTSEAVEVIWRLPVGSLLFRLDPLSAFFLIPILIVAVCVSLYACGYSSTSPHNRAESWLTFYFGLLVASILLLVLSASVISLLFFWEAMALLTFLAMCMDHSRPEVRTAGMHYLIASHISTLCLIVMSALLSINGNFQFPGTGTLQPSGIASLGILLTALVGFGLKAGIMPLHIWLPGAHANAPSHISAFMSGIVIKMGIYGLLRMLSFFSTPPLWWGVMFLCFGIISSIIGVLFAIGQHDIKDRKSVV